MPGLQLREMTREEFDLAIEWAAEEGWNPGLHDGDCFYETDPHGFVIALRNGEPVGTVSVVTYDERFCFGGFFIIKKGLREQGIGTMLGLEVLSKTGGRTIGMDAVPDLQAEYGKYGFQTAFTSVRYHGVARGQDGAASDLIALADVDFGHLVDFDARHFPARREVFLKTWISQPEGKGLASMSGGDVNGYAFLRKCREGYKFGPVFARDATLAGQLIDAVAAQVRGATIFLDVPAPNEAGTALAKERGMEPVFETARMYRGTAPLLPLDRIFGVTSFELG